MTQRIILFIALHRWMTFGWMMKVAGRVEMSFVVNALAMMLKCVPERNLTGIRLQPLLLQVALPLLLLIPMVTAQLFLIVRMILRLFQLPLNQREVVIITTPIMMMTVFLQFLLQSMFLREHHHQHLTLFLRELLVVLVGQVVSVKVLETD
jgi:hypothetical protein